MRLAAAAAITLSLLVGTYYYTTFADSVRRTPVKLETVIDEANWRVELFRTFVCVPDPEFDTPSLVIQLKAQDLLRREDMIPVTEQIALDVPGFVEEGDNELYVEANLATVDDFDFSAAETPHALRMVVKRGSSVVSDHTFWLGEGETSFKESLLFSAPRTSASSDQHDEHSHFP